MLVVMHALHLFHHESNGTQVASLAHTFRMSTWPNTRHLHDIPNTESAVNSIGKAGIKECLSNPRPSFWIRLSRRGLQRITERNKYDG